VGRKVAFSPFCFSFHLRGWSKEKRKKLKKRDELDEGEKGEKEKGKMRRRGSRMISSLHAHKKEKTERRMDFLGKVRKKEKAGKGKRFSSSLRLTIRRRCSRGVEKKRGKRRRRYTRKKEKKEKGGKERLFLSFSVRAA